jgi:hypothetical protein
MKQVPDRKRLRREYLRQKTVGHSQEAAGAILYYPALIGCLLFGMISIGLMLVGLSGGVGHPDPASTIGWTCICVGLSAGFGLMARQAIRLMDKGRAATRIPYVPPVTPDTLPADEILVRGAEEPLIAQNEVLLRAARQGQETPKEELLRGVQD